MYRVAHNTLDTLFLQIYPPLSSLKFVLALIDYRNQEKRSSSSNFNFLDKRHAQNILRDKDRRPRIRQNGLRANDEM